MPNISSRRSKRVSGFVASSRQRSARTSRRTTQVSWSVGAPGPCCGTTLPAGKRARKDGASGGMLGFPVLRRTLEQFAVAVDLLLDLENAVDQAFGRRRAAGHVDVHRDELVDALDHVVGAV